MFHERALPVKHPRLISAAAAAPALRCPPLTVRPPEENAFMTIPATTRDSRPATARPEGGAPSRPRPRPASAQQPLHQRSTSTRGLTPGVLSHPRARRGSIDLARPSASSAVGDPGAAHRRRSIAAAHGRRPVDGTTRGEAAVPSRVYRQRRLMVLCCLVFAVACLALVSYAGGKASAGEELGVEPAARPIYVVTDGDTLWSIALTPCPRPRSAGHGGGAQTCRGHLCAAARSAHRAATERSRTVRRWRSFGPRCAPPL